MIDDALILKILDGQGTSEDERLLDLYLEDEANCEKMIFLMELESDLRAQSQQFNLIDSVMSDKRLGASDNTLIDSVMLELNQPEQQKKHDSKKHWTTIIFSIAASITLIVGLALWQSDDSIGKIVFSSNDAQVIRENNILPADNFTNLQIGDTIHTQDDFSLAYEDNTLIDLLDESTITIQGTHKQKKIFLQQGHLRATVKPQTDKNPFIVTTEGFSALVVGTRFIIHTEPNHSNIRVEKGTVRVQDNSGQSYLLEQGQGFFVKNEKTRWLGSVDQESFNYAQKETSQELDLSDLHLYKHGKHNTDAYFGQTVLIHGRQLNAFSYHSKQPLLITSTTICNITIKTDAYTNVMISLGHKKTTIPHKFFARKPLSKNHANHWQTISIPLVDFHNFEDEFAKEDRMLYTKMQIHSYIQDESKENGTYLEIGAVWFTDNDKTR